HYQEAIRLKPNHAEAHNNLGAALVKLRRFDEAVAHHQQALQLRPNFANGYNNLANAYLTQRRHDDAVANYREALRLRPDYAEAHMGRALIWLTQGDFERGLAEYEWRWQCKTLTPFAFKQPVWDGTALHGRTIVLHAEQGLGDTLQFVRYAALV